MSAGEPHGTPPGAGVAVLPLREEDAGRLGEITVAAYVAGEVIAAGDGYAGVLGDVAARMRETLVLGAYRGTEVVGGVTLVPAGGRHAEVALEGELEIRMLAVALPHQGQGVAEALLRASAETAEELGYDAVVLSTRDVASPARRLYERLGYARRPERDWVSDWDPEAVAAGTAMRLCVYRLSVR